MTGAVKSRNAILNEIIKDAKKYPKDWKAVFGKDRQLLSNDYYLFHPNVGLYLLKEYQKNPFERKGVGGKIERHVDEHISNTISSYANDFGIIQGDINKIAHHIKKGMQPHEIINAAIQGKNMGLTMPLRGQASDSDQSFHELRKELSTKQQRIDKHLKKNAQQDGLYTSY